MNQLIPDNSTNKTISQSSFNELHKAFCKARIAIGLIDASKLIAADFADSRNVIIASVERLTKITTQMRDDFCEEFPNYPDLDARRQPANLTPTLTDLNGASRNVSYSYKRVLQGGIDTGHTANGLQWLCVHAEKLEAIVKQLLINTCGGTK